MGFEDVLLAIEMGNVLDYLVHPNPEKYPNQSVFIILVSIKNYVYIVPYIEDETTIFLKTIIPSRKMNKRYNTVVKMTNPDLDAYEQDILKSVENNEWQSKGNLKERLNELQHFLKHEKKKAVSIRLSESDLYELKRKSLENGIPYQNLIQILVHQYTHNKIHLDVS